MAVVWVCNSPSFRHAVCPLSVNRTGFLLKRDFSATRQLSSDVCEGSSSAGGPSNALLWPRLSTRSHRLGRLAHASFLCLGSLKHSTDDSRSCRLVLYR